MKLETQFFSGIYQLKSEQVINASLDEVWAFFSTPKNLDRITPNDMAFKITSDPGNKAYAGQIIAYKIEILPGIQSSWITEITHLGSPFPLEGDLGRGFFVDEQRFGPYEMWHHEHHFEEIEGGKVKMTDIVSYKLPLGWLGRLFAGRLIKNKVKGIFQHRFQVINELFK